MNEDVFDGTEAENLDLAGAGEAAGDYGAGEHYYGEASEAMFPSSYDANLARARAQARARALASARRYPNAPGPYRQRVSYMPPTASGPASTTQVRQGFGRVGADMQRTQAAIRNVDLENKVQADVFGRALRAQHERIAGNESGLALTKVVDELKARVPELFENEVLKTVIPLFPLLFLKPEKKSQGIEGFISDPRVWGPVLTAAIALFSQSRDQTPQEVTVTPGEFTLSVPPTAAATSFPFRATVRDSNRRVLANQPAIVWESSSATVATVDANGNVTPVAAGTVLITATVVGTNVRDSAVVIVR